MSLIILKDSYISLEDANTYIHNHYLPTDSLRVSWDALDNESREILLRKAFIKINRLPFTGRPSNPQQSLPFPRFGRDNGLENVGYAQIETAIHFTDKYVNDEITQRKMLQQAGVKKYSIGDLSEEFTDGASSLSHGNYFGLDFESYNYLKNYLGGGYKICTSIKHRFGK